MNSKGTKKESAYDLVYGETFALYKRQDLEEFIEPLAIRFQRNGLKPEELFLGARCLDAGCGNGRGSIFMLRHGAAEVTAVDVSHTNINSTKKFAEECGFTNLTAIHGTLESLPFPDGHFDFVWCNGVIMHTSRPNRCLAELARVLRRGGNAWLYIYGSGGVYWRVISHLRNWMAAMPPDAVMACLRLLRYEPRYVGEFMDDWYASHLRCYTQEHLNRRLGALGFESPAVLPRGVDYDTSERRTRFSEGHQQDYMGEGDLRYLLKKGESAGTEDHLIDEGEYGSAYQWPASVMDLVDPLMSAIKESAAGNPLLEVAAAANLQRELRLQLTEIKSFDADVFRATCLHTAQLAGAAQISPQTSLREGPR